ncbi:hypothetical protein WOLCODRAFT_136598 [Wolfiporia cocos MD-104 SS10]|uniref:Uncharacterized protein n=1 Tax=Wolfiporia cocos (strain MD-104) TaxID=742152 RepID=A0A2H3JDN8_WOLCO|nr:hypothetical protein WOLCODRAFT_136598 [Wolfiporia cocos MD-104 SS10]
MRRPGFPTAHLLGSSVAIAQGTAIQAHAMQGRARVGRRSSVIPRPPPAPARPPSPVARRPAAWEYDAPPIIYLAPIPPPDSTADVRTQLPTLRTRALPPHQRPLPRQALMPRSAHAPFPGAPASPPRRHGSGSTLGLRGRHPCAPAHPGIQASSIGAVSVLGRGAGGAWLVAIASGALRRDARGATAGRHHASAPTGACARAAPATLVVWHVLRRPVALPTPGGTVGRPRALLQATARGATRASSATLSAPYPGGSRSLRPARGGYVLVVYRMMIVRPAQFSARHVPHEPCPRRG